jgi:hypothetical protein
MQLRPGPYVCERFMSVLHALIAELSGFVCSIVSSRDPLRGCLVLRCDGRHLGCGCYIRTGGQLDSDLQGMTKSSN